MLRVVAEFTAACDYTHCLMIPGMNLLTVRGTAFCCLAAVFRVPRQLLLGFGCFFEGFSRDCAAGCTLTYVVTCPGSTWCFGVIARGPPSAPLLCVSGPSHCALTVCIYYSFHGRSVTTLQPVTAQNSAALHQTVFLFPGHTVCGTCSPLLRFTRTHFLFRPPKLHAKYCTCHLCWGRFDCSVLNLLYLRSWHNLHALRCLTACTLRRSRHWICSERCIQVLDCSAFIYGTTHLQISRI